LIFYAVFDLWQLNAAKKENRKGKTQKKPQTQEKFKDNNIQSATKSKNYQKTNIKC
jgi:hypothetical protein